jgi:hypothetical protein
VGLSGNLPVPGPCVRRARNRHAINVPHHIYNSKCEDSTPITSIDDALSVLESTEPGEQLWNAQTNLDITTYEIVKMAEKSDLVGV